MVLKKQYTWSDLGNLIIFLAAIFGAMQVINSFGPCESSWKFQDKADAEKYMQKNELDHMTFSGDMLKLDSRVSNIETKLEEILDAVKRRKKEGKDK